MKVVARLLICVCLAVFVSLAPTVGAESLERVPVEDGPAVQRVPERLTVSLEMRLGATTAPYFTRSLAEVRGHGIVGVLHAGYRISDRHSLGLALPLLAISVEQPAGSYLDELTWGNLDVFYRHQRALLDTPRLRLSAFSGASLALPIAEQSRSASLLSGRALRIGSALDGFRHPELYTEGVLPLAASIGMVLERRWVSAEASLRLPLLIRFSDAELSRETRTRPLGFTAVLHLALAADATRWLALSLSADTVVSAVAAVETARDTSAVQLTLAPALTFRLPRRVRLGTHFVLPVGGALGGSTYAGSVVLSYHR